MSDIGEGLGTGVEGSWFARAVEPESGAKSKHPHQPDKCLNCETPLVGAYCHACGQAGHIHRSLGAFWHDLLHGALHFEGKFWRTLPMLALRPGRLTRRYIDGARARFVSPMALFLFAVFLMFAVFQMLGMTAPTDLPRLDAETGNVLESTSGEAGDASGGVDEAGTQRLALDDSGNSNVSVNMTGIEWIDQGIGRKWRENPSLMLYKLQANSYKFSWLLIPLSVPFVWLLFAWKRGFNGYDHAIFATYSLSFMTLLFVAISTLDAAGIPSSMLFFAFVLIPPIHLYKHMRGTYSLNRWGAFWRLLVLSAFIWVIAILFLQILLALGAF